MIQIEYEQVSQTEDDDNIVKRRVEEYPIVIEVGQKYIGVESNGSYRVFERGVVKSLNNVTGEASNPDRRAEKFDTPILQALETEYLIIHGDLESMES